MGSLAGARPYYERALAILTARLGADHSHTQTMRDNLAAYRFKRFPKTAVLPYNHLKTEVTQAEPVEAAFDRLNLQLSAQAPYS
jgi:hypothetical protein